MKKHVDDAIVSSKITSFQLKKIAILFGRLNHHMMLYHRDNAIDHNPFQGVEYRKLAALILDHKDEFNGVSEQKRLRIIMRQFDRYWTFVLNETRGDG